MVEVRIEFAGLSKEQTKHLYKARKELGKTGVDFDSGYNHVTGSRDWEFDWSLKGAKVVLKKA